MRAMMLWTLRKSSLRPPMPYLFRSRRCYRSDRPAAAAAAAAAPRAARRRRTRRRRPPVPCRRRPPPRGTSLAVADPRSREARGHHRRSRSPARWAGRRRTAAATGAGGTAAAAARSRRPGRTPPSGTRRPTTSSPRRRRRRHDTRPTGRRLSTSEDPFNHKCLPTPAAGCCAEEDFCGAVILQAARPRGSRRTNPVYAGAAPAARPVDAGSLS